MREGVSHHRYVICRAQFSLNTVYFIFSPKVLQIHHGIILTWLNLLSQWGHLWPLSVSWVSRCRILAVGSEKARSQ